MFKKLKRWWKVKKLNKALLKQATLDKDLPQYGYDRVSDWLEKNEFNLRLEELNTHSITRIKSANRLNIDRDI